MGITIDIADLRNILAQSAQLGEAAICNLCYKHTGKIIKSNK